MKIVTYNINGARASSKLGIVEWVKNSDADIICVQEIRASREICENIFANCGYSLIINSAQRLGYAGTMVLTKIKPNKVTFGCEDLDDEGRVITLFFDDFIVVDAYIPNGSSRLNIKLKFVERFIDYVSSLDKMKPIIICADMNTAQTELDLSNPKACSKHSGFLEEERELQNKILQQGFIDVLRQIHTDNLLITWRSYKSRIVGGNYGWKFRFDYIYCSKKLSNNIQTAEILQLDYSDHLPIIAEFGGLGENNK